MAVKRIPRSLKIFLASLCLALAVATTAHVTSNGWATGMLINTLIPFSQSLAIHRALPGETELLLVNGVGHVHTNHAPEATRAIARWLDKCR